MNRLGKPKNRRLRGAELVLVGGTTMFMSNIAGWLGPMVLAVFGIYRLLVKKSYRDGVTSLAVSVLLLTLLKGPLDLFLTVATGAGGFCAGLGAVMMVLPSQKPNEIKLNSESVNDAND